MLLVESLSETANNKFVETTMKPYLTDLFKDLVPRSNQYSIHCTCDKNTFVDYVNLPGVVSDRFFALASGNDNNERVELEGFLKVMLEVYEQSLETKMKLVFDIFDFNGD